MQYDSDCTDFRSLRAAGIGRGKLFYFRPGHESVPTYHNPDVQKVLVNAAAYVYTPKAEAPYQYGWVKPTVE